MYQLLSLKLQTMPDFAYGYCTLLSYHYFNKIDNDLYRKLDQFNPILHRIFDHPFSPGMGKMQMLPYLTPKRKSYKVIRASN